MRKSLKNAAVTLMAAGAAMAASAGAAGAAPIPTGPAALGRLTGLVLPGPDVVNGNQENGSPVLNLEDTNLVPVMSDLSRTQTAGTSANQG